LDAPVEGLVKMNQKSETTNRLVFFDNLRYLMILLVLIFHSGASYGSMVAFWPFHDANPTELIDIIMILFDVFMMTILFLTVLALKRENAPRVSDPSWISYTGYNYGRWADRGFNIALGLLNDTV
jgi:peptidoglycan/LPS O-acetylase OafA/YrhL